MKQITCMHCGDTYLDFDATHVCSKGPYAPRLKPKMNERIRELAKHASDYARGESDYGYFTDPNEFKIKFEQKFAELIVRECGVALNPPVQNRNVISRGQAYDLIKKHFGVEE